MKIFVDFDDVVFNARRFKEDLIKVFAKYGVTRTDFENSYYTYFKGDQTRGKYYNPKDQIKVLKKRGEINIAKLGKDIDKMMKNLGRYVFSDVIEFLADFKKKDLFLITYGHMKFQLLKIKGAKIRKYFQSVIISKKNKINDIRAAVKQYKFSRGEAVILIDDRPEQIEQAARSRKKVVTFRICRPEGRYSNLICLAKDWEVKNLKEAARIIKNEKLK